MNLTINDTLIFKDFETERAEKMDSLCSDSSITEKKFQELLSSFGRTEQEIQDALTYAKGLDFSKNHLKSSYLSHPIRLASYVLKVNPKISAEYIVIALLHNVPETTEITVDELEKKFGATVASGIDTLVIDRAAHFPSIQDSYYKAIFAKGKELVLVKLLDKIDNLFVLGLNPDDEVRKNYLEEIRKELLPFTLKVNQAMGEYLDALITETTKLGYSEELRQRLTAYQKSL